MRLVKDEGNVKYFAIDHNDRTALFKRREGQLVDWSMKIDRNRWKSFKRSNFKTNPSYIHRGLEKRYREFLDDI
jgi:hypothetical protein